MSVLNITHRLETNLLTKKSENIFWKGGKKKVMRNTLDMRLDLPVDRHTMPTEEAGV